MKFEYPIPTSNPADKLGQANTVGFYPIGRLFNWHGGLHVSERSESAIHAIADGVIIAYRITNEPIELNGIKFSNNFVLIKHEYVSPEGRELRFYSLYNHLMTFTELSKKKDVPVFLGEAEYKVKGGVIKGLNLRSSEDKEDKYVVPKGMTVELDSNLTPKELNKDHWAQKDTNYKKVKYKDPFTNKVIVDRFMYMGPRHNKKLPNGSYEIITKEDTSSEKGENIRPLTGDGIKFVLPNGTKLQVDGFTNTKKNYYKIKSIDGKSYKDLRIFAESCVKSDGMVIHPPKKFKDVVTGNDCVVEVKAGDTIGWSGYCGFANQPKLKDCHVEVFTDQDPAEFITGKAGNKSDIEKTKKFTKIKKGAKLALKYPISFKKDDEIKVLIFSEDANEKYCQIKLHKQEREVDKGLLKYTNNSEKKNAEGQVTAAKYTPGKLKELNVIFNDSLNKKSIIDWVESIKDKKGVVTNKRKVLFTIPAGEHMYWVEKSALGVAAKPQSIIKLTEDLTTLYFREPKQDIFEFTLGQDEIFKNSDLKKTEIQEKENTWYKIKTFTPEKNEHGFVHYNEIEGFIKKDLSDANQSIMSLVSAFNWETFGFKIYKDQPDEFVLNKSIAELTQENSPAFIKSVWNHIDEDGDGKLTKRELKNALQDLFPQKKLSKMICYHQSEWGVNYDSLKSEIETLLDEGIKKEKNAEKKQKLEDKKQLTLNLVKEKIGAFDFWSKVKIPIPKTTPEVPADEIFDPILQKTRKRNSWEVGFEYGQEGVNTETDNLGPYYPKGKPEEKEKKKEKEHFPFPISNKVYHFHPIAFVEQMKRVGDGLIFPLSKIPLNHKRGYKSKAYKEYDYTKKSNRAAPFGQPRSSTRLHAGCDLYGVSGDSILSIDDGVVISVSKYYNDTWQITIKHEFEIKKGHKVIVRYGEVNKNNRLVNVGDKVTKGQKIAEMGLLIPYIEQPKGERRGMLHFEMYTGEASGNIKQSIAYKDMLYSESEDEKYTCKSDYQVNHMYQRRKDLINAVYYLNEMIKNL